MTDTYEVILTGTREVSGVKCLLTNHIVSIPITHTLENIDALIFTSSYAIVSLIESALSNPKLTCWKQIPSFVISPASAQILHAHNANIEFIGKKAYGKAFANEICPLLKGRKPLYLRAKKVISDLRNILGAKQILIDEVIAYENIAQKLPISLKPKPCSVIIFPAPSSYYSFKKSFGWDSQYKALAIGYSTFMHFDKHIESYMSPYPNLDSCILYAKQIAHEATNTR